MIDDDDADFFLLFSMGTPGWIGVLLLAIAIAVIVAASQNKSDCRKQHCDSGKPKVVENECVCVQPAGAAQ